MSNHGFAKRKKQEGKKIGEEVEVKTVKQEAGMKQPSGISKNYE